MAASTAYTLPARSPMNATSCDPESVSTRPIVTAARTLAAAGKYQWIQPVEALSAYTLPLWLPTKTRPQPTVVGGRVFVGSQSGNVYALNASTGCIHWYFPAAASVRAAVTIGRVETDSGSHDVAFIGDRAGNVYAVEAAMGTLLWKTRIDNHPVARVTGSPVFHNGRLYVPVASGEETAGATSDYECCRFRGSLVALDSATGSEIWKTYTIAEQAQPTKKNKVGTQMWGPSGAPIWSSPVIDVRRNALYVTTGDNYSNPPTVTSDAFLAFELDSGRLLWSSQMLKADAWNTAC